jgi:hypothetical protein
VCFQLCEKLIKKMGNFDPPPYISGKIEIWASSIVHTIGNINFLFDKSFEPYIIAKEIHDFFGSHEFSGD